MSYLKESISEFEFFGECNGKIFYLNAQGDQTSGKVFSRFCSLCPHSALLLESVPAFGKFISALEGKVMHSCSALTAYCT